MLPSNRNIIFCKQTVETVIRFTVSDLCLPCLLMSHKKDTRFYWLKQKFGKQVNRMEVALLFNCTAAGRPSDSMTVATLYL